MTDYVVYDVFTDTAFGGNQLAVIPDARRVSPELFQKIAGEFNFSETVFVVPPTDTTCDAKLRIFTPRNELRFAGHPTIGTAIALRDLGHQGDLTLELGVGPIPCRFQGDQASFTTAVPLDRLGTPAIDLMARAIGIAPEKIITTTHAPVEAGLGTPFNIVEIADRATLSDCHSDLSAVREGAARGSDPARFAILAYVRDGATVHARMFSPLGGIPEDPATGSAAAALAALLHETLGVAQTLTIHQGHDMGRPSLILAQTAAPPLAVTISGTAVKTMEGRLVL